MPATPPPAAARTPEDYGLPTKARYTVDDYRRLPEGAPFQLIDGQLVMSPAPRVVHQRLVNELLFLLNAFVRDAGLGGVVLPAPTDVRLGDDVVQPDVLFVAGARRAIIGEQAVEGAPDLVAEVLSPSTAYTDLRSKRALYARHGVREFWIVDPPRCEVEVLVLNGDRFRRDQAAQDDGVVRSRLLDGFTVDVAALFASV
jgi:Uma2 family endonuclease